jgi:SAM-dependent methyltransferase
MTVVRHSMRRTLSFCVEGRIPANIALMQLIAAAPDRADLEALLTSPDIVASGPRLLGDVRRLWRETPQAWALVKRMLAEVDHRQAEAATPEATRWREVFDRAAAISPEAASALYVLGRDDLALAAESSIVARLEGWGLVSSAGSVVDVGCGAGRLSAALAPRVRCVIGVDQSPAMLAAARERCLCHPNVRLVAARADDLGFQPDASIDVVLACDVLPYVVPCGDGAVAAVLGEAMRVLRPGGRVAILNYSYRGSPEQDLADVRRHASAVGLEPAVEGVAAFEHWDGKAYVLVKPPA